MAVEALAYQQKERHVAEFIAPPWRNLWQEYRGKPQELSFFEKLSEIWQKISLGEKNDWMIPPFNDRQIMMQVKNGYKPTFVLDKFSRAKQIPKLAKLCGLRGTCFEKGKIFTNEVDHSGYRYLQYPTAPGLNEEEAIKLIDEKGGELPTLNEVIVASVYNKMVTGRFLMEGQMIRILGTKLNGKSLSVGFNDRGELFYGSYSAQSSRWLYTTWSIPCP